MKKVYLVLIDEVNCVFDGLKSKDRRFIIDQLKMYVEGYRHTARFQIGAWDGKEAHFDSKGYTFQFLLPKIVPMIENLGYEIVIIDDRERENHFVPDIIDENFLKKYGIVLREWQVEALNEVIRVEKGLINAATSAGKTIFCGALCKAYDGKYKTLTIVPSENLANQTHEQYLALGLDAGINHGKIRKKKDNFQKPHVVSTWQSLTNQRDYLASFDLIIYDEAHIIGDVMFELLADELAFATIRLGLTGTLPKTRWKRESLCCHIGGDEIYKIKAKQLQDEGQISTLEIRQLAIVHDVNLPDESWETEKAYLVQNKHRLRTLVEWLQNLKHENTLILVQAEFGDRLAKAMPDLDYINQSVKGKDRNSFYKKFDDRDDYELIATYGTVGTGISIDRIKTVVLIDAGKSESRVLQGIGRGLRLDGEENHLIVYDLYSELWKVELLTQKPVKYGFSCGTHLQKRRKMYKDESYPFTKNYGEINVTSE